MRSIKTLSISALLLGTSLSVGANANLEEKINILAQEIQELKSSPSSSNKLSIGGYGEIVYKNTRTKKENGSTSTTQPTADALRNVLYVGYKFDKNWKLTTEIEVEHADEIFLEQGTIDYTPSEKLTVKTGVNLIPMGITNLEHEPTTFFGVNRPDTESKILPTTWREIGVIASGKLNKFSYHAGLVNGLLAKSGTKSFTSDGIRNGRQKASQTEARDLAWVARADYHILPSFMLGASAYVGKAGGVATDVKQTIWDIHTTAKFAGVDFKALYVHHALSNVVKLNNELGLTGTSGVGEHMNGVVTELGYNVLHNRASWELLPFIRYEQYNTQSKVAAGFTKDPSKERKNMTFGVNVKPNHHIVFKADYIKGKNKAKTGTDSWNLGVGWHF